MWLIDYITNKRLIGELPSLSVKGGWNKTQLLN